MDLQISLFLLLAFVTAGHSLSCYKCLGASCAGQTVITCPTGASNCESVTVVTNAAGVSSKMKIKDCSAGCSSGSIDLGTVTMSTMCCNSNHCNAQDAPDPSTDAPNGNTCYSCEGDNCTNTLKCSGSEDRCIKATGTFGGYAMTLKGCASKSICDAESSVSSLESISCCSGNLCNGAKSVTQSFLILCFPLIAFIIML